MGDAEKQELLAKLEKEKLLKEMNDLNKGLISYKRRQEKYGEMKFTESQKKKLNEFRLGLRQKYNLLRRAISKYGGDVYIKVVGMPWDAFIYSLSSPHMDPNQFTALDTAINVVNRAIEKVKATPIASTDWRDITVIPRPKGRTEEARYLFDTMQFHPKVIEVSKSLFETGHYSQAIFEAFKAVNNLVKQKTGLSLDGKDLMAKVFREEDPIIKLNELKTRSEKDEQEGFKFLFMGAMVGIRNPKAHNSVVQTDPYRTLEYLAFASLLMRRVTEGKLELEK